MIKELAQYIENNTSMVIGTDLFAGWVTQGSQDTASVLTETGGATKDWSTTRRAPTFQVISRGATYHTARDEAFTIFDLFNGTKGEITLPVITSGDDFMIENIVPISSPQYIGQDQERRFEFSTNYLIYTKDI